MSRPRTLWIAGAATVALLFGPGFVELARMSWRQRQLDRELEALTRERERLKRERQRLAEDPTYVEGLIRSTFKVARPTEYVVPLDDTRD